jgi:Uma2 family endonuclease
MSPAERTRVVASLPPGLSNEEMSPPEGDRHLDAKIDARDELRRYFYGGGRSIYIGSELTVYYPGERRFAPDVLAVWDVEPHPRDSWIVSAEGKGLDWVLEMHVGGDRKKDAEHNVAFYAKLGIPEYFIYDRKRQRLEGHRLPPGGKRVYVPIVPQAGHYPSETLGLELVIEDSRLRFYARNAPLLGATEMIEHLRRMVEQVEASADERQHAETEARRVLEVEVEALRAEIERLKKR